MTDGSTYPINGTALFTFIATDPSVSFTTNATYANVSAALAAGCTPVGLLLLTVSNVLHAFPLTYSGELSNQHEFFYERGTIGHRFTIDSAAGAAWEYMEYQPETADLIDQAFSAISGKLDIDQGSVNAGKSLVVGSDGNITVGTVPTATDAQVASAVDNWLADHPEATTTVEDGAVSAEKLSDSLAETLGVTKQAKDRSVDLREMCTAKAAKWATGGVTYPTSGCNCVEFAFTIASIADQLPEGLTRGTDLLLFGAASGYKTRMHFVGTVDGETITTKPDSYSLRTTSRIVPAFENLTTVYVYVYSDTVTAPTASDVETFRENLIASAVDMLCGKSYDFGQWLTSAIAVSPSDPIGMRLFNWDEDVHVKTVLNYAKGQITGFNGSLSSGAFRFFNADFTSLRYVNPGIQNARDAYATWTMGGESFCGDWGESSFDWGDVKFILPHQDGTTYLALRTYYIGETTEILDNSYGNDTLTVTAEEENTIKSLYPFLNEFRGLFDRKSNFPGTIVAMWTSGFDYPWTYRTADSFSDLLSFGAVGDWCIYRGFNPFCLKDRIVKDGDIIYKSDAETYLALDNPLRWDGWQTCAESSFDVVIVGGGAGGIGAAYALRNSGLKVLLCDKMENLGGTHTQAGLHSLIGSPVRDWFKPIIQDAYHVYAARFEKSGTGDPYGSGFDARWNYSLACSPSDHHTNLIYIAPDWLEKRYHNDISNGGITIRLNRKFICHNEVGGRIGSLVFLNTVTGAEEKVFCKCVIDCTGDVHVGRYHRTAGTDFFVGSDPRSRFNEPAAAVEGNERLINTCEIMYRAGVLNTKTPKCDGEEFLGTDEHSDAGKTFPTISGVTSGQNTNFWYRYYAELGDADSEHWSAMTTKPNSFAEIISPDYHCGITTDMLLDYGEEAVHDIADDYARAHYRLHRKASDRYYGGCYPLLAIRESYRMNCEVMATQADLEDTITSANYADKHIVALSSWYADLHAQSIGTVANTMKNGIKYESMVPTSYSNLLIACRGYGASHIALSGMRLIKTMMSLGRAAGFAAKQYVDSGLRDFRDVDVTQVQSDAGVGELLEYLEENVYPLYEES